MAVKSKVEQSAQVACMNCKHFRNSPQYLESVIKGMSCMSSGHASIKKDDGICLVNDVYLQAEDWCDKFESRF